MLSVILVLLPLLVAGQTCYWPDGSTTSSTNNTFVPCYSGPVTHCCNAGELCMSNGLCFGASLGLIYRGACTDQSWQSDSCGKYCLGTSKWANFFSCDDQSGLWCHDDWGEQVYACANNETTCCNTANGDKIQFTSAAEVHIADATVTPSATQSAITASTTVGTQSSAASSDAIAEATSNASSSASSGASDSDNGTNTTAIGAGVGVGVGIPLAAGCLVLGIMLRRERKKRKQRDASEAGQAFMGGDDPSRPSEKNGSYHPGTVHQAPKAEMAVEARVHEMDFSRSVNELPASYGH